MTDSRAHSTLVSLTVHAALIALLLTASKQVVMPKHNETSVTMLRLTAPVLPAAPRSVGGGGGEHAILPASGGHLPRIAPRQFVPPVVQVVNVNPKLVMEPTIEGPPDLKLIDQSLSAIGDALSKFLNASAGTGGPLGIGNGHGTGVGNKTGAGAGNGDSINGTVYRAGNGVTAPILLHRVEPEFSEEARKAKHSGVVLVRAEIDQYGHPRNLRLARSLGLGLDEKAIEAVSQWLFKPGTKDGKAVAVSAVFEVSFRLL